jgi:transposase
VPAPTGQKARLRSLSDEQRDGCRSGGAGNWLAFLNREGAMARRTGPPRKLTDAQIRRVLAWHTRWQRFHSLHGTQRSLAQQLQVKKHLIHGCIARYRQLGAASLSTSMIEPKRGRPKTLQDRQLRVVIAWHLQYQRFLDRHGSAKALAHALSVSERTIHACIGGYGAYRQLSHSKTTPTPLTRSSVGTNSPTRTRVGGDAATRLRGELLKNWRRISR